MLSKLIYLVLEKLAQRFTASENKAFLKIKRNLL